MRINPHKLVDLLRALVDIGDDVAVSAFCEKDAFETREMLSVLQSGNLIVYHAGPPELVSVTDRGLTLLDTVREHPELTFLEHAFHRLAGLGI